MTSAEGVHAVLRGRLPIVLSACAMDEAPLLAAAEIPPAAIPGGGAALERWTDVCEWMASAGEPGFAAAVRLVREAQKRSFSEPLSRCAVELVRALMVDRTARERTGDPEGVANLILPFSVEEARRWDLVRRELDQGVRLSDRARSFVAALAATWLRVAVSVAGWMRFPPSVARSSDRDRAREGKAGAPPGEIRFGISGGELHRIVRDGALLGLREESARIQDLGPSPWDLVARWERLRLGATGSGAVWPLIGEHRYSIGLNPTREPGRAAIHYRTRDNWLGRDLDEVIYRHRDKDSPLAVFEILAQLGAETENVVKVFFAHTGPDDLVAIEALDGEDLASRIRRIHRIPPLDLAPIVRQIAGALGRVHLRGLVHRDIKPERIFLCAAGDGARETAKLVDFGAIAAVQPEDPCRSGFVVGTPAYMAPEAAQGHADPRSDVWSLGVVIYEALTGKTPYEGTVLEVMGKVMTGAPIAPPTTIAPDLSAEVDAFVARALARSPEDRFQSVDDLANAFQELALR